jgi:hypothetical protein
MYRQGIGDCLLVTLPRPDGARAYHLMIDCGVILGTENASQTMTEIVSDIVKETSGHVDLLLVTHEHWDHVSGFLQAAAALSGITFGAVWMGWTESPEDEQGQRLAASRARAVAALRLAESRLRLLGVEDSAEEVSGLVGFFGAAGGGSTPDAMRAARALARRGGLRYAEPGEPPTPLEGTGARLYVLGPPRDEQYLLRSDPSRRHPETYGFGMADFPLSDVEAALGPSGAQPPFGPRLAIPIEMARAMPEFRRYWSDGGHGAGEGEAWRRIDSSWVEGATELALKLDHDTNNTSLVVAIELADRDVLLFAADAQVGSWLSWQELRWSVDGRDVTGRDLIARTVFYKVGHHGSHNATLRENGLERMERLQIAAIPVDEAMARKRRWGRMPLPALLAALQKRAAGAVVRSDKPAPSAPGVAEQALYFDMKL